MNRQYKHNLSCTMHITDVPTNGTSPSVFNRELQNIYWICHNHRRPYRQNDFVDISQRVEKYLLNMPHSPTSIQTEWVCRYLPEVFNCWPPMSVRSILTNRMWIPKRGQLMHLWPRVLTDGLTDRLKILEGYLNFLCEIQNFKVNSPAESLTK